MPPRRAQLGGQFGGATPRTPNRGTDYSSIVDAVLGGTANLLQVATARKLAERAEKQRIAAQDQARNDKLAQQQADEAYRRDEQAQRAQQFATQQETHHDDTWNTNARLNANDEYQRTRDAAHDKTAADLLAHNQGKEPPVPGSKEWESMLRRQKQIEAEFAPAKEPKAPNIIWAAEGKNPDGTDKQVPYAFNPRTNALEKIRIVMDTQGPQQPAAQPNTGNPRVELPASPNAFGANVNPMRMGSAPAAAPIAPVTQPQAAPAQMGPRFGKKPAALKPAPSGAIKEYNAVVSNLDNLGMIEQELATPQGRNAVGYKNMMPDAIVQRNDPRGVKLRALISNFSSLERLQRSGAAVTPSEAAYLVPYLLNTTDSYETIQSKLPVLKTFMDHKRQMNEDSYNEQTGYAPLSRRQGAAPPQDFDHIASQFDRR